MKAYKCDRCGRYFDPPRKGILLMFGTGSTEYEVCPDCYKEVEGYLKNESIEDLYTAEDYCRDDVRATNELVK